MYLPSLPMLEDVFHATTAEVQRTLATYFVGFATGQALYGPIADRFGRKPPLYGCLILYVVTCIGCAVSPTIEALAAFRLFQAIGACGGAVIARAMVRDMFPPTEIRKAFSTLLMINGVAPAISPTCGGLLLKWFGWSSVFWFQALLGIIGLVLVHFRIKETLTPEKQQPLHLGHIFASYGRLLTDRTFLGASLGSGLAAAGMFAYIAGAPFVFIELFKLTPQQFSWMFGTNAVGIIITSNINGRIHGVPAERVFRIANLAQLCSAVLLLVAVLTGIGGFAGVWLPLMCYISCVGFTYPNGSTIALAKHGHIAGIASALLGTNQFLLAAITTTLLGVLHSETALPMAVVIVCCAGLAVVMNFALLGFQRSNR